jgi:hypothetical protein
MADDVGPTHANHAGLIWIKAFAALQQQSART